MQLLYLVIFVFIDLGSAGCRDGFVRVKDWCFSFNLRPTGLQETTNQCESQGAGLVTLDSAEKERALTQFIEDMRFFGIQQDRSDLQRSLQELVNTDNDAARFCEDFQKYGEKSKSYTFIKNAKIPLHFDPEERANLTTPEGFRIELSTIPGAGFGGFTERFVPKHTILGSYEGLTHLHHREDDLYSWQVEKVDSEGVYMIDAGSPAHSNWLRWLNCAGNVEQENVVAVACAGLILYMTTRDIEPGSEMFVWYGDGYGDYLKINRVHPESDLQGIFNIRASILSFDEDDRTVYSDGTPVTFTNWVPEAASDFVDNEFGLVLTYNGSNWKWFPEKDYRYFTGPEGLHLPYVCEDKTTYNEDGVIDPEYTEEDDDSVTERFPEKVVPPLPGQGLLKPDVVCDHIV
ncbi:histone-lysine N-methyltransferase PRDM9 [Magallana gigas]|uniref:histone-lysine N-methyltransferase PRDM9 n=1 Tax=Magallana gigas TaxID=29159 RepID=UPI003341D72D